MEVKGHSLVVEGLRATNIMQQMFVCVQDVGVHAPIQVDDDPERHEGGEVEGVTCIHDGRVGVRMCGGSESW